MVVGMRVSPGLATWLLGEADIYWWCPRAFQYLNQPSSASSIALTCGSRSGPERWFQGVLSGTVKRSELSQPRCGGLRTGSWSGERHEYEEVYKEVYMCVDVHTMDF